MKMRHQLQQAIVAVGFLALLPGAASAAFKFEQFPSLDEMRTFLASVEIGTPREQVRAIFVNDGGAGLYVHPSRPNVEKYVYVLNLCHLYVWRWNVSANFDDKDGISQIFLNGEAVFPDGDAPRHAKDAPKPNGKGTIAKMFRPRPEANLGEDRIAFLLYDIDPTNKAIDDEFIIGAGPSRADPTDFGKMHVYNDVERWRSIFDFETAPAVIEVKSGCRPV